MKDLSPLAWIMLCGLASIIVVMNLALVILARNRNILKMPPKPSRSVQSWQRMGSMIKVLRDPFAEERKQLNELSGLVDELDENKKPDKKANK